MNKPTGYVFRDPRTGSWIARVTYTDENTGKRRNRTRSKPTASQAEQALQRLLRKIEKEGTRKLEAERKTFAHLAEFYESHYLIPPVYEGSRKVAGLRSYKDQRYHLDILKAHFGKRKLESITYAELERFKRTRLTTPTHRDKKRSLANVHRTLSVLRAVLKCAEREGWIAKSPFAAGKSLITMADEQPRRRVLSYEEEERLLAACVGRRAHVRAILICALDTGMRRGEMSKLAWRSVDLAANTIHIEAFNTKTMRARTVPISARLAVELAALKATKPHASVFGVKDVSEVFQRICAAANVPDIRQHDLRHTFASRLAAAGMPLNEIAALLGHTTVQMTFTYANASPEAITKAAQMLNQINSRTAQWSAAEDAGERV